ncbi:MAG TPA: CAP domain-containing protein, partial [Polyangiaceae bacterium]|nr:CAP domain-containing protein [Polyangiaceae bacterium]
CVDTINSYRASLSLPPYKRWVAAESCGDGQAQSDSASGVAHGAFGKCTENAQNECPGWPGPPSQMIPQCLAMMWAEGPGADFSTHGHFINMSSTQYTEVGCGFYTMSDGTTVWAVQDFK